MENPVQAWINSDKKLYALLEQFENSGLTILEQAELCLMFDLPKMPEDKSRYEQFYQENDIEEGRSVFEENALLKYFNPDEDIRSILITAVYSVKNFVGIDLNDIVEKEFDENFTADYVIAFRGSGVEGEIVFPQKEGKNWIDLGCFMAIKMVQLKN